MPVTNATKRRLKVNAARADLSESDLPEPNQTTSMNPAVATSVAPANPANKRIRFSGCTDSCASGELSRMLAFGGRYGFRDTKQPSGRAERRARRRLRLALYR